MARVTKILLIFLLLSGCSAAYAKNLKSSLNDLIESLDQLIVIKKSNSLPADEKNAIEIEARKATFSQVLDLASEEIKGLIKKLEKTKSGQSQIDQLNEYLDYYELIKGKIYQKIEAAELIDVAQRFKKWREEIYNKETEGIISFILAHQNREMIKIAEIRLGKILKDWKIIKALLKTGQWNGAEELIGKAKTLINEAKELNQRALHEQSVQKISEAYQNFIALSALVYQ